MKVFVAAADPEGATVGVIRRVVEERGHEVVAVETPGGRPAVGGARAVFERDFDLLSSADILVADASSPSLDVGWKVAWTLAKGRLVVVCVAKDAAPALTPVVAGNPSPWQRLLVFTDERELEAQLAALFS